jgi:hypothetical protein
MHNYGIRYTKTNTKPIIIYITRTRFGSEAILKEILKPQL